MASPVGEDNWIDYVDQQLRGAHNLESRVLVIEQFRRAAVAEPGSIKVWTAYCEYFWSLHVDCQPGSDAGWPREEQEIGRLTFSLDDALNLWQQGYEAVKYRLNDSHELWNRWISLEMELLAKTRTEQGVKRITHLFKNRLAVPHATWNETSQLFSSFLSEYNRPAYEHEMQQVTENARDARKHYELRETFELRLRAAQKSGNMEDVKKTMLEYLDWEMFQYKGKKDDVLTFETCLGLYARALTGLFAADESTWINYIIFLSSVHSNVKSGLVKSSAVIHNVPNMLDTLQRAVLHVPWSGTAWARYILSGEEAGLSFTDMESIKHAATSSSQLDRDGMSAVLAMYSAWCGYLKRRAMDPNANEEAVDLAEIGLPSALEDVQHWGKRRYGDAYQGDPNYRLEKLYIQFLTEKKDAVDDARGLWDRLSKKDIHANSYDFWLNFYLWEMVVFASAKSRMRSPTPATLAQGLRVPSHATRVFIRALHRRELDWPERVMEVYLQHCNDYEVPDTLRQALDTVHKTRKSVAKRREREARETAEAQAAAYAQAQLQQQSAQENSQDSPAGKRKRDESPGHEIESSTNKRAKNEVLDGTEVSQKEAQQEASKRDRENTSVFVTNLPAESTQTKVRQYFREYGHVNNIGFKKDDKTATALIEFRSPEEAQSALLRDGKYFTQGETSVQISVRPASGCTLYLTNYPPEADEKYIRRLFRDCGEIFSLRFPSLKYNATRRFCYVTFLDSGAAAKATKLDGKLLEGKYKLVAKYSDPSGRQQRSGAQAEEREVHVQNLHREVKEEELEAMFSKHGKVQSVRILRDTGGHSYGTAFVVMETKEQAQAAIAGLDKDSFRNRILSVELSKMKNFKTTAVSRGDTPGASMSLSPAPDGRDDEGDDVMHDAPGGSSGSGQGQGPSRAEIAARTIAVLGIPDTVNDARVRAMVEPHGDIVRLVLHPGHGGAVVEFRDKAMAGKASLALEGKEIEEGRKVHIGTVAELFRKEGETRVDRIDTKPAGSVKAKDSALMPPPPVIRRTLGTRGGKRGGLVVPTARKAPPSAQTTNGTATNGVGESASVAKKSNADFKNMFLNAGNGSDGK